MSANQRIQPFLGRRGVNPIINPDEISNLEIWIDPSDSTTVTSSSGFVSRINDKSSNSRDMIQPSGGSQLPFTTGPNGLNFLDCGTRWLYSEDSFSIGAYPITIITIFAPAATDSSQKVPASYSQLSTATRRIMFNCASTNFGFEVRGAEGFFRALQSGLVANKYNMIEGVASNSSLRRVAVNAGAYSDETTSVTYPASTHFFIGRSNNQFPVNGGGIVGETLMYSKVLSDAERLGLKAYFENKYGTFPI